MTKDQVKAGITELTRGSLRRFNKAFCDVYRADFLKLSEDEQNDISRTVARMKLADTIGQLAIAVDKNVKLDTLPGNQLADEALAFIESRIRAVK